jgi:hypothetical protein
LDQGHGKNNAKGREKNIAMGRGDGGFWQESMQEKDKKELSGRPCLPTMPSSDSDRIQSKETGIVTALSAWGKIHTFLHHEGLRKDKKKLRRLSNQGLRRGDSAGAGAGAGEAGRWHGPPACS